MRPLFVLGLSLFAIGCSSKTYLHLTIEGAATLPAVASVDVTLSLAGQTAVTTLAEKSGAVAFPTAVTFDLRSGSGPITILAIAKGASGQEIIRGSTTATITRGEKTTVSLTLGQILVEDGGLDGPATDGATADGPAADSGSPDLTGATGDMAVANGDLTGALTVLELSDATHDFGNIVTNTPSGAKTFTLTNNGNATSGAITTTLSGANAPRFVISNDSCNGMTLAAAAACSFDVVFTPTTTGLVTGVSLTAGDGTVSDSATLQGTGVAPGALELSGDPNYGIVDTTATSVRDFTVTNNGGAPIGPLVVASSNNSQFAAATGATNCGGKTLAPTEACTQTVTFQPSTFGSKSSTLTIGPSGGPNVVASLTGTGRDSVNISASAIGTGNGTITGSGLNCGNGNTTCTVAVTRTTTAPSVTLTATAVAANSTFTTWGNACSGAGAASTCNLTMSAPQTVSASFALLPTVNLSVAVSGIVSATGTVSTGDGKINCTTGTCSASYVQSGATMVTLTATPSSGMVVVWGGDCASSGSNPTCTLNMAAARSVKAKFRPAKNIVFISSASYNGNLGGVAGGDAKCQALADAVELPGTYKAWLAGATNGASHLQSFNASVRGWIRLDGVTFADTLATLNSSGPTNAPLRNESNVAENTGFYAFKSAHTSAGAVSAAYTCSNWTTTTGDTLNGNWTITGATWQSYQVVVTGCGSSNKLLCMGVDYSNAP